MKKKRLFTRVLMVCLLLCSMCVPVLGAEEDSKGLEQAIISAKKLITVPDKYTDFSNYSNERETIEGKIRVWTLNWSEKDKKEGSVSVTISENGSLYEYSQYNGDKSENENETGLAQVSKENAQISAEEFLKKVIPADAGQMKIIDKNSNNTQREKYYFTYKKFVNDIPVDFVTVNVGVNKYSGEVTSYNGNNSEIKGLEYPTVDSIMEPSVAEKAYTEKLGVSLKYYSHYDYNQKKMNVFAGYSINDNRNNAIDAKTGQVVVISNEDRMYKDLMDSKSGNASLQTSAKSELTKEETDAVNNVSNLITKDKAESIIRETFDIKASDIKVNHTSLNKNHTNENYVWNISFEGASGSVDAKSGEVLSMYYYNNKDNDTSNKKLSKADAKNIAEDLLKKIIPTKFAQTKYQEDKNTNFKISTDVEVESDSYNFNFIRQVNGIEFSNNGLYIQVDKAKGKVIGYDNNWYENAEFPNIDKSMTKEDAFNKIKALSGFGLQYILLDKNKVGLVYNFKNINENYIIDPISGTRLDYAGQPYKDNKLPEYKDISGHWCEKIVKELLNNGYYIDGENFNPDKNITQIKFFKYIYSRMQNNYTEDDFYDMLIQNGVIKKEEKAPDSLVSNQDAAKFIVRYLGYEKIAIHPEIFTNPFKDTIEEKDKGYAAICYGLGITKGDQNGNFNGSANITNAGAASLLYNLVSVGTKNQSLKYGI